MSRLTPRVVLAVAAIAFVFTNCGPMKVEPELTLTASPRTLDGAGQKATIRIAAADDTGKAGSGTVRLTSTAGSLKNGTEVMLANGEGSAELACDRATDATCTGSVRITGEWVVSGKLITTTTSVTVTPTVVDAGSDAGMDAGVDAGTGDAGTTLTVTSDKTQIISGVGDVAVLTATLITDGAPVANASLTFNTSIGRLGPVGGASVGMSFNANTNASGQAQAQLVATGSDMGQAMITVTGGMGMGSTSVVVVNVSAITYLSTTCPQTAMNCNLMGLQSSGFNETAQIKFKVTDSAMAGVPGVPVTFSLINAPAGTTIDPSGVTNSMGEVAPTVRSGTTVGTFSVQASALNGTFTVTSPTIGVRGAKASNRGFTLRCAKVNLGTLASPNPPVLESLNCNVGLSDRYGNPVGTGTQVRLNSEAGTVPNNVTTQAFMPGNMGEGTGMFTFQTMGTFPPLDVPPLAADPLQFPFPRFLEPGKAAGPLTKNPRDGLVTIIAYLQGEEDFKDDNSNGVRDGTEQFIDQGEPFVDRNDNNVWDVGEFFVDTPPADGGVPNGQWDGPNGAWDSNAQIWTEFKLLYTGATSSGASCVLNETGDPLVANGYGTLALNAVKVLPVFVTDDNLNRPEAGSNLQSRFSPATRGSTTIVNANTNLDGYGFTYERRLVSANLDSDCSTTESRCVWRSIFGSWTSALGGAQITGASPPAMNTAQTLIVDVSVRGITNSCGAPGTVE